MNIKKEDWNYAAGVATGMEQGSNKPVKTKKKYKFKSDVSSVSGMMRSYYEENKVEKKSNVAEIMTALLEEVEKEKKISKRVIKEEAPNTKLLEDFKTIKLIAQKGINAVSNGQNEIGIDFLKDILGLIKLHKIEENVAETEFTNTSMDSYKENLGDMPDAGKNNPTE